jgi:hypothetical protein
VTTAAAAATPAEAAVADANEEQNLCDKQIRFASPLTLEAKSESTLYLD